MKPFEAASARIQIERLRNAAVSALGNYSLTVRELKLSLNGQNTTFCMTDRRGRQFSVRVTLSHLRHITELSEELEWMEQLARNGLRVPRPVRSRANRLCEGSPETAVVPALTISVFDWLEGKSLEPRVNGKQMKQIGRFLAQLRLQPPREGALRQKRWDAEGLAGRNSTYGDLDRLDGVTREEQALVTHSRRAILSRLRAYQRRFPSRLGVIHGDMHLGNALNVGPNQIAALDFEESGFGFFAYDLVIPVISARAPSERRREYLRANLIEGYREFHSWDDNDELIFDDLTAARGLVILGWLNSSRQAGLRRLFRPALISALRMFRERYGDLDQRQVQLRR